MIDMCALALAVVSGMTGWHVFIRREKKPKFERSAPLPMAVDEAEGAANKHSAGFLRELVRLAEENMKELDEINHAYERKATLMASLGMVVSGYLLSGAHDLNASWWGWVVYSSLALVVFYSAKAIDLTSYVARGLHPNVVRGFFHPGREPNRKEAKWTLYFMLEYYRHSLDENIESTYDKYKSLLRAKFFLVIGASGCVGMVVEHAGISARICRWLARYLG